MLKNVVVKVVQVAAGVFVGVALLQQHSGTRIFFFHSRKIHAVL